MSPAALPIRIEDPDDERIAGFRQIREKDLVQRQGRFIAEGTVVLSLLAESHANDGDFGAEALLVLENRLAGLEPVLAKFPADVPLYVASRPVMNAIAGFDIHRGVLAIGMRRRHPDAKTVLAHLPAGALVVVAGGISNHDNIGSIFRNAAVFGADAVLLDETCCDPLYRKAIRVSVGTVFKLPFVLGGSHHDLIASLNEAGFSLYGLSPQGQVDIRQIRPTGRMALLTGAEGEGLPAEILNSIQTARIPQAPGVDSLNAATATGIALFAIASAMGRL
ncbi:TrmH family RNA methyltransferase [Rhizobium alvei]|uniref:RNA methyltransferase n=1 Tax=Rhizobium alvei TaxID=1132659 RepID=A0ABT8YL89_9HYPH|nr:RNA methyltransferase [Rhizobium alvei]MDO6964460.1 RNA methyltransferase [Rhizobium alvei]